MTKTKELELRFLRTKDDYHLPRVTTHYLSTPNRRADFAMRMMEKFGLLLGEDAGEDSAGRQKGRRLTPKECAVLACETSDHLFNEMESRDWFTEIPSMEKMEQIIQEQENKNENGGMFRKKK